MPVLPRRQLQIMLDDLGPWLTGQKARDLLGRIESKDADQSIPGEYELALAWGVSKVAELEIDVPAGSRRPDIYSKDLLPDGPIAIEVTAMSDDPLSDETIMRRAASIINQEAGKYQKGASRHLHYTFNEESGVLPANRHSNGFNRYYRRRRISKNFAMTPLLSEALKHWIIGVKADPLHYSDSEIDVLITWKDWVHPFSNTFSSMPGVTYDVRDNPLYNLLKSKAKQLRSVPSGTLRGIFLGDAGCSLLRDVRPVGWSREVTGEQIIHRFLQRNPVDVVAVFSPKRENEYSILNFNNPRLWHASIYSHSISEKSSFKKVELMTSLLPKPSLHGYQARSWHQQGMTNPQARGHYLGAKWTSGTGRTKVHISARGLQEFIAGRLTREQLAHMVVGESNPFERNLLQGRTIASVSFEARGPEKDDDYIVFEFDHDPAAAPLSIPGNLKPD